MSWWETGDPTPGDSANQQPQDARDGVGAPVRDCDQPTTNAADDSSSSDTESYTTACENNLGERPADTEDTAGLPKPLLSARNSCRPSIRKRQAPPRCYKCGRFLKKESWIRSITRTVSKTFSLSPTRPGLCPACDRPLRRRGSCGPSRRARSSSGRRSRSRSRRSSCGPRRSRRSRSRSRSRRSSRRRSRRRTSRSRRSRSRSRKTRSCGSRRMRRRSRSRSRSARRRSRSKSRRRSNRRSPRLGGACGCELVIKPKMNATGSLLNALKSPRLRSGGSNTNVPSEAQPGPISSSSSEPIVTRLRSGGSCGAPRPRRGKSPCEGGCCPMPMTRKRSRSRGASCGAPRRGRSSRRARRRSRSKSRSGSRRRRRSRSKSGDNCGPTSRRRSRRRSRSRSGSSCACAPMPGRGSRSRSGSGRRSRSRSGSSGRRRSRRRSRSSSAASCAPRKRRRSKSRGASCAPRKVRRSSRLRKTPAGCGCMPNAPSRSRPRRRSKSRGASRRPRRRSRPRPKACVPPIPGTIPPPLSPQPSDDSTT